MDSSRIASYNGATISIHGPGANQLVGVNGAPIVVDGKPVAVRGVEIQDGTGRIQLIDTNGNPINDANGKPKFVEFKGDAVSLKGAQTLTGPVTLHLSLVEQGNTLLTRNGQPVQVLRAEAPLDPSLRLVGFDPVLVNGNFVLVTADKTVLLAPASQVTMVRSLPGPVTVGSNVSSNPALRGAPLGITTLGGGGINVFATGDINVEKSRVSTFNGGDINLTSTHGRINAGSGSKDEAVEQVIEQKLPDGGTVRLTIRVPSSGISTFHPDDPRPLKFIEFHDPQIDALLQKADREKFFGRDAIASALVAEANRLKAQREPIFNETILKPFINSLKLGDVFLVSERVSVDVPPAGIQGRRVEIFAPTVNFQGGSIVGNVIIPPTVNVSGPPNIVGTGTGAATTAVTPLSGGGTVGAASTTAVASSTSAKSTETVQETAAEVSAQNAPDRKLASKKDDEKDSKSQLAKSIRVKRGVVIQVDVKPEAKQGD